MPTPPLMVGSLAPEFSLACTPRRSDGATRATLADYRGRWLMLTFYPRDFSLVCPTEMTAISSRIDEFTKRGCEVLGISTDTVETHERWIAAPKSQGGLGGLNFPLAADPDGAVCRAYGVFLEWQKLALRGLFIIDPNNVLQYAVVHNTSVGRRTDELLRILDAMQSGGLCPENWSSGAAPLDPAASIVPGTVLAHYRFESTLGSGSFATVFKAIDTKLERTVAIKVIQPGKIASPAVVLKEARAAASLHHPRICTIFSVDDSEGVPLIVMEYAAGGTLGDRLKSGPLPVAQAREIAAQTAAGMAAAHAAGVVHGDLKPENILLSDRGEVKISDFGLARRERKQSDVTGTMTWNQSLNETLSGTPSYMAPELLEGEHSSPSSDVFALGVVLYEMLTGHKAIDGASVLEVLERIRTLDGARLAAEVPAPFSDVVRSALARQAGSRPSMESIAQALADV